jgi:polysaccharide chain length determinant protein (PEP-CTERM system associated)
MLPGKTYTPEMLLGIVRRRFWLVVMPVAVMAALTATIVKRLPDMYWAETVILVVPQKVPESYVRSTVTETLESRLQSLKPTILSRTRLEQIITEFDLYPADRQRQPMEDIVERMRNDVAIGTRGGDSFSIGYVGPQPVQVMEVTNRLASLFIDESLRDRLSQAEGTDKFLESQLQDAKAKLIEKEKRLAEYQRVHAGELPSQISSNLQQAASAQQSLSDTRESINRDRDRRLVLEQQLDDLQKTRIVDAALPSANPAEISGSPQQQLAQAEAQVAAMEAAGFKAGHPDLDQAQRRVRDLRARIAAEASASPSGGSRIISPAEADRQRRISDMQAQIAELDRQMKYKQDDEKRLQAAAEDAQRRADALPTRESELTELMRDYSIIESSYNSLLAKKQESQIAANLEQRQIGEQFRMLDQARLPERPFSPNRAKYNMTGAGVGLAIGLALLALLEYRDRSFRTDEDLRGAVGLPVLAVIPVMQSDADRRRAMWRALLTHGALASVVVMCLMVFIRAVR